MTLSHEIREGKKILRIHNEIPHVPIDSAAEDALHKWLLEHREEIRAVLDRHSIPLEDVALPHFERIIRMADIA